MDYSKDFEEGYTSTTLGYLHFMHHAGDKAPVIFLHGFGASLIVWKRLFEYLDSKLDIYAIDMLGHGLSSAPRIAYTISIQSKAVNEFIEKEVKADPYLFGHSYGGWVSAYYAHENSVKGLMLEDPAGIKENFDEILSTESAEAYKKSMVSAAMQLNNNKEYVLRSIVDSDFGEEQLSASVLSTIRAKTLILWGENDNVINPKFASIMSKHINGSLVKMIKGAGHNPHYDNPNDVSDAVSNFIVL